MALAAVSFFSNSLGLHTGMNIILPDGKGPFPVFYLLHGLSDDQTAWCRRTGLERYVEGLPLIVVMPTTHRGWYTNAKTPPGLRYEDHILKDVMGFVKRMLPVVKSRQGRVVGGLSMGGYGALKLALKYPDLFCSATSHSGATFGPIARGDAKANRRPEHAEFDSIFGLDAEGGDNDPAALAAKCPKSQRPALRIDCGKKDFLIQDNRRFHAYLNKIGYQHQYQEFPGEHNCKCSSKSHTCGVGPLSSLSASHDWDYWDLHIQEAIVFHCKNLGIKLPKRA